MRDDIEKRICTFLNWWDDYLEETRYPSCGEQDDDLGECAYPVTYEPDQRALVAQLCEGGCCTSVHDMDDLVEALRELTGRQAPEQLPPDSERLFRLSEDDHKVWAAEFSKAHPDAFFEVSRGPAAVDARVKSKEHPAGRQVGQLPEESSPFWDELYRRLTNRERTVLWNVLRLGLPGAPVKTELKQSQLTAELEYYMSKNTCERAVRMLRRRGMLWLRPEGGDTWLTITNSGAIVADRMFPR